MGEEKKRAGLAVEVVVAVIMMMTIAVHHFWERWSTILLLPSRVDWERQRQGQPVGMMTIPGCRLLWCHRGARGRRGELFV